MNDVQEIIYNGSPAYDKVEIWKDDKGFRLKIVLTNETTGMIHLFSEYYQGIREADERAVIVARQLGLDRDSLPVHIRSS